MERIRKWAILGRLAAIVRSRQPDEARLAFEADLAARLGLSRGALRNYADAVKLVRDIPEHGLRTLLFRSSAVAASTTARWFRRDPDAVHDYLRNGLAGNPSRIVDDRALLRAARVARPTPVPSVRHRWMPSPPSVAVQLKAVVEAPRLAWRNEIIHSVPQIIDRPRDDRFALADTRDPLSRFLGLTCAVVVKASKADNGDASLLLTVRDQSMVIGFIEIDQMVTLERYRTEARPIWTRAIAANVYFGGLVVLVLPSSAARRHMLSRIPIAGADWINHPQASVPRRDRDHPCRSRPVIARFGERAIMISTRRSLLGDIFDEAPSLG